MNKKIKALIITAVFLLSGCGKNIAADTAKQVVTQSAQVTADNANKSDNTKTEEAAKANTAETEKCQYIKASEKTYFGHYVIKKLLAYGPVSTYGNEDIQDMIGKDVSFSEGKASCFGDEKDSLNQTAENPVYKEEVISKAYFESDNRITFEKLGLKGDSITQVTAQDSKGNGSVFYIKDENTIILYGGGIYLELVREK